ncbi:MAG: hypothetical protein IJ040_06180 [Lachnospiraceae bacterium]|nr:hypothetical protein [Lachnospiraceae bacterium]
MITASIRRITIFIMLALLVFGSITLSTQLDVIQSLTETTGRSIGESKDSNYMQITSSKLDVRRLVKAEERMAFKNQMSFVAPTTTKIKNTRRQIDSISCMAVLSCAIACYFEHYQSGVCSIGKQDTSGYCIIQYIQLQDGKK